MDLAAQLRLLQNAQGDPAKLALAAVDLAFPSSTDAERDAIKQALEAAAIPHWCNGGILAALLDLPLDVSAKRLELLDRLNEVEAFEARGEGAINIHEAARLALRKYMAREDPERFRALSAQAAAYFAADDSGTGQIEWIYHRLCAAPDEGAAECEVLVQKWDAASLPQDRDALALALHELETTGLVEGRARLEVLLCFAQNQVEHSEMARVAKLAPVALALAKQTGNATGEARAYDLLGEVLRSQEDLQKALDAHQSGLRIRRDLAAANPSDTLVQWGLAVAYGRVGDVHQDRHELDKARESYGHCADILNKLLEDDPQNVRWLREAVVAFTRMGDILKARGNAGEARKIYAAARIIIRKLVADDPANEDWQRDLAMALYRIARLHDAEHAEEAREALEEYFRICRDLLSHDPDDARRLSDLADGYETLATIELAEDHLDAARAALAENRSILQQLLSRDPTMVAWSVSLAVNFGNLGVTLWRQKQFAEAQLAAEEALKILRDVSMRDPANLQRQRDLAIAHLNVARVAKKIPEHKSEAISHYEEAIRLYAAVIGGAPERTDWAAEQKSAEEALAAVRDQ